LTNKVINEIVAGNGNQFSMKEMLQAHIRDDKEFKKYTREQFDKIYTKFNTGSGKIITNREGIKGLRRALIYGIGPLILVILGWLASIQLLK